MKTVVVRAPGEPLAIHEARPVATVDDSTGEVPRVEGEARIVLVLGAGR
ncbi:MULTISPECIES: hypothetical protein [unclassified Streptomyces]|jgi:hypothetical protein